MKRGILLDRDGVLNQERADYVKSWAEFVWLPGVLPALQRLAQLEVPILVITNQSVIGRGIVPRATIEAIHQQLRQEVFAAGGRIDAFFICPHHPDDHCSCRKPQPGLLLQAAAQYGLTLADSIFIGDAISDYQAAKAAGCQSILVESGRQGASLRSTIQQHVEQSNGLMPPIVTDLAGAVTDLLNTFGISSAAKI